MLSQRETRLRRRIDALRDQRDELRTSADEKDAEIERLKERLNRRTFRRCAYCSRPTYGFACDLHRDLVQAEVAV